MSLPNLIDNKRVFLGDVLKSTAPNYDTLNIATGYWDLAGSAELINELANYKSIRLLIGQEPISSRYQKALNLKFDKPDDLFPGKDIETDLVNYSLENYDNANNIEELRETTQKLCNLINNKVLEVKVYRKTTLHAKTFIFGDFNSNNAVAILGSSNFTKAGLYTNTELNTSENDYRIVVYEPKNETQENGYLTWFDSVWNDEECIPWTGDFKKILQNSPVGNLTYGPYDAYIKTLMEIYPEELLPPEQLPVNTEDILYSFQLRNAGILINKLHMQGIAILADSVGLGKTITAGAVMKYYIDHDPKSNILIIAPAALKQQWKDDLASILGIDEMLGDYRIVTQQDTNAIQKIHDEYEKEWRIRKHIDLFVIDEAHNLRSGKGQRHEVIIKLLEQHPDAHVLLLTATPINNSLMDLCNIIQLASRGNLKSVSVSYPRPNGGTDYIDFFEALKKIQSGIKKAENNNKDIDEFLSVYKPTIHEGLRHYLVRSTRQGVEAEGGIIDKRTGKKKAFPKSEVINLEYKYDDHVTDGLFKLIGSEVSKTFEQIDPRCLNLTALSELTQQTCHPLDFLNEIYIDNGNWSEYVKRNIEEPIFLNEPVKNLAHNILQLIFLMGFVPYRPNVYQHKYWGKTPDDLKELEINTKDLIQFAVHNIMQITWLKRLESSAASLLASISNYEKRIALFEKYLDKGYIVTLSDASLLESDYNDGEDIEKAFDDYENYLKERETLIEKGEDANTLKKYGVERINADPILFNIKQIRADLSREHTIIAMMKDKLKIVAKPENDPKIKALHDQIKEILSDGKYGKKVLVFSFFADTINYIQKHGKSVFCDIDSNFEKHSGFISGQSNVESVVGRFSPTSKKYKLKEGEEEINFLFSTDVLSEGQNLQDAGYLINYDLHWNPVRMIQRNGRVNRLGSIYDSVLISNMKPLNELELYLNLVNKLERKIKTIRGTIGLDQGVLSNKDVNPIEFIEKYYKDGTFDDEDDSILAHTDKHILELRKYLGANPVGSEDYERVKNIPLGKWNYLSTNSKFDKLALSFVKVYGKRKNKEGIEKYDSGNFFIESSLGEEGFYKVGYINIVDALDTIQTTPEDNKRNEDRISINRERVSRRVKKECERQYLSVSAPYTLKPNFITAIETLIPYISNTVSIKDDIRGVIEKGVSSTILKEKLESILKKVNHEKKQQGRPLPITIQNFIDIFHEIQENIESEKEIIEITGILNYARNN